MTSRTRSGGMSPSSDVTTIQERISADGRHAGNRYRAMRTKSPRVALTPFGASL
jgi:hypothetical protein